jgi:hypothetical protein
MGLTKQGDVDVEAATRMRYHRSILLDAQLSYEVYSSFGGGELRCNVLYSIHDADVTFKKRIASNL